MKNPRMITSNETKSMIYNNYVVIIITGKMQQRTVQQSLLAEKSVSYKNTGLKTDQCNDDLFSVDALIHHLFTSCWITL